MLKYEKHTEIEISDEDIKEIIDDAFSHLDLGSKERNIRTALSHYRVAKVDNWDVDQIQLFVDKIDDIVNDISSLIKKKWTEPDIMELSLAPIKTKREIKYPCDNCIHNTDEHSCFMSYGCEECDIQCNTYLKLNLLND